MAVVRQRYLFLTHNKMSKIHKVFIENQSVVRRIVAKYRSNKEDVEDLVQDTFLKCFAADLKQTIHDPKAFIFRVAKNVAISEAKRKRHSTTHSIEDLGGIEVYEDVRQVSPERQVEEKRKLVLFSHALAELPPELRCALVMRKIDGLKFKQIATRLGVSVSTVEKRVATALLRCNSYLREQGHDFCENSPSQVKENQNKLKVIVAVSENSDERAEGGER